MDSNTIYDHKQAFQKYLEKATEKKIFVGRFSEMFCFDSDLPASFLDIGCHDGTLTIRLLDSIVGNLPKKSKVHCVDPSHEAIEVFRRRKLSDHFQFIFHELTAEDYLFKFSESADWIIASHCFYWSPDLEGVLNEVYKRSDHSVVVLRGKHGIYQIQSKYKNLVGNPLEQLYTADDIENALVKLNVSFEREDIVSTISVPKPDNPMLTVMIGFFLQRDPESITPEIESEVYSFISNLGTEMRHDVSFFWIDKS